MQRTEAVGNLCAALLLLGMGLSSLVSAEIRPLEHADFERREVISEEVTYADQLIMAEQAGFADDGELHPSHMGKDPRSKVSAHHSFTPQYVKAHIMKEEHKKLQYKGTLSINVSGFGKTWTLDLLLNQVAFGERSLNFREDKVTKKPIFDKVPPSVCYYHGFVRGDSKDTWVAASTCDGFTATFYDGETAYNTAPLYKNATMSGSHIIYRTADAHSAFSWARCGTNHSEGHESYLDHPMDQVAPKIIGEDLHGRMKRQTILGPNSGVRRVIDFLVITDRRFINLVGGSVSAAEDFIHQAVNIMDLAYNSINMRVSLSGLAQFSGSDPFTLTTNGGVLLDRYIAFVRANALSFNARIDTSQFVTGVNFDGNVIGLAPVNTVCTVNGHSLVEQLSGATSSFTSLIMSHELGHVVNMLHDGDPGRVTCNNCAANRPCIMFPSLGTSNINRFSQCSVNSFNAIRNSRPCLATFTEGAECGDGVVGEGEECDCGFEQVCDNPCCNAATCRFIGECDSGDCCDLVTCSFRTSGATCRAADGTNRCDLEDFCSGNSPTCPETSRRNGEFCADSTEDLCWEGNCITRPSQCQVLFGGGGTPGNDMCFTLNVFGNQTGNCGLNLATSTQGNLQFTACAEADALCGKLHCGDTGADEPVTTAARETERTTISVDGNEIICKGGTILDPSFLTAGATDITVVRDGQSCGNGNVCLNGQCQSQTMVDLDIEFCDMANSLECNGRGVCDTQRNCRCNNGFLGTACEVTVPECPAENPCLNGGSCMDGIEEFTCACPPTFTGLLCADVVDNCMSTPCQNEGTCTSGVGTFSCQCTAGFTGDTCQTDFNECASGPCQNDGMCNDLVNAFQCDCLAGFTGVMCETVTDECLSMPCLNDGECTDLPNAFMCTCPPGFTGVRCETGG
ncbi:fibropellin-1-like [Sycon ciliatum]|uniref:fibropellin-1-like n=1 Tax=Sycon ciliatum TaxID=27933 RepID=UPI0031F67319